MNFNSESSEGKQTDKNTHTRKEEEEVEREQWSGRGQRGRAAECALAEYFLRPLHSIQRKKERKEGKEGERERKKSTRVERKLGRKLKTKNNNKSVKQIEKKDENYFSFALKSNNINKNK